MSGKARTVALLMCVAVVISLAIPVCAWALTGDQLNEYNTANSWRGVAGDIKVWPYVLLPDGQHVSSFYVKADPESHMHVETGIVKLYGWTGSRAFWQYNTNPNIPPGPDNPDSQAGYAASLATGNWVYFEANNFTMHGSGWSTDQWRMAWNGNLINSITMSMRSGMAIASNEREKVNDNGPDDSAASFNNVKKKNNSGSWSLWVDARGFRNDDPFYFWHADATYPNSSFWESDD